MPNFATELRELCNDSPYIERIKNYMRKQFLDGEHRAHVETRMTPELRKFLQTSGLYVDYYPETDENYGFFQAYTKPSFKYHEQPGIYTREY